MNRDIICIGRLIIDSLPIKIRNSRFLFKLLRYLFKLPDWMWDFRKKYDQGLIKNLKDYNDTKSSIASKRISPVTDINSGHIKKIIDIVENLQPSSILDLGCGEGHLLSLLNKKFLDIKLEGIDFNTELNTNLNIISGDLTIYLKSKATNSFDLVICTHTLEHIADYKLIISDIRRVSKYGFIIVCPIEKKFKWGMNNHINFFQSKSDFIDKISPNNIKNELFKNIFVQTFLGDILYYERESF